jgi:hypothetical protein
MSISSDRQPTEIVHEVWFGKDRIYVRLADGREIGVPLTWFPRLERATAKERNNWRLIGNGIGIHWADLDEDIAVESLLRPLSFPFQYT